MEPLIFEPACSTIQDSCLAGPVSLASAGVRLRFFADVFWKPSWFGQWNLGWYSSSVFAVAICVFCFEGIEFCFKSPLSRFQDGVPNFRSLFFRSMSLGSFLGVALQQVLKKNPRSENWQPMHIFPFENKRHTGVTGAGFQHSKMCVIPFSSQLLVKLLFSKPLEAITSNQSLWHTLPSGVFRNKKSFTNFPSESVDVAYVSTQGWRDVRCPSLWATCIADGLGGWHREIMGCWSLGLDVGYITLIDTKPRKIDMSRK